METKKGYEYTQEEFMALKDNKDRYCRAFIKVADRITGIVITIRDHSQYYTEKQIIAKRKKLEKLKKEYQWTMEKMDDCDKHLKIIYEYRHF